MTDKLKELHDKLDQATLRIGQIILLAWMLNEGDALPDPLIELLEGDGAALRECFPDIPKAILDNEDDEEMLREDFVCWAHEAGKLGFMIQFERPVMKFSADGRAASYSWGQYSQRWVYGDTIEEAVSKGLEWANEREKKEKTRASKIEANRSS